MLPTHAFYVSVTDIRHEVSPDRLSISIKIFTDDLEDGIRSKLGERVLLQDGISEGEALLVNKYLSETLSLSIDKQDLLLLPVSCKIEGDAVFTKYSTSLNRPPKELVIRNKILLGVFPTQTNIVRLRKTGGGMLRLTKQHSQGSLTF